MNKSHGDTNQPVSPLLTDLYQLAMMEAYLDQGMTETAVFELFVRRLPEKRSFLMAAGLEQALAYLETLRFVPEEIDVYESYPVGSFPHWPAHGALGLVPGLSLIHISEPTRPY